MGVLDGQAVSAGVTNPAFIDANADDTGVGKYTLANTEAVSGATVDNVQAEANSAASFMGKSLNSAKDDLPAWTTSVVGSASDPLFDRADALTERFVAATGHTHDGTDGEGPQILAANLDAVPLKGYVAQGTNFSTGTGSSVIVTGIMTGKTPGGSTVAEGVVTTGAYNRVIMRQATGAEAGDAFTDALGNEVYGRLTEAAGVWTISFFTDVSGVETAYTFASSASSRWYYQEIFNPMGGNAPVFSEFASIPSDNATADVIPATTTLQGKVSLSASAPGAIASTGSAGTATASVANADHTHEGLHSIAKSGDPQIKGDATLSASGGVTLTQSLNDIQISGPALASTAPSAVGSANSVGTGTTSARADHVHEGVHSVGLSGDPDLYGDVTLAASGGTSAVQAGQTITFSSPALTTNAPSDVGSTAAVGTGTASAREDHVHRGVTSVAKNGSSQLFGNVTLSAGSGITINQVAQDIQIVNDIGGLSSATPQDVGATASAGVSASASRDDHVHEGLHSIAKSGSSQIVGDATLSASGAITLTQTVNDIQISAPATDTVTTPQDVGSAGSPGVSTSPAPADHVHEGVHSVSKNGSSQIFGDVTLSAGSNVTITQVGNDISFSATAPGAGAVESPASYPVTLSASDDGKTLLIDTSAARTINAFAASANFRITIKDKTGTAQIYPITFVRSGSQKIEGLSANYVMEANWGEWGLAFDGTDWFLSN